MATEEELKAVWKEGFWAGAAADYYADPYMECPYDEKEDPDLFEMWNEGFSESRL
jgi:hypothetical protein